MLKVMFEIEVEVEAYSEIHLRMCIEVFRFPLPTRQEKKRKGSEKGKRKKVKELFGPDLILPSRSPLDPLNQVVQIRLLSSLAIPFHLMPDSHERC